MSNLPSFQQIAKRQEAEALLEKGGIDLSKVSAAKRHRILESLCEALQRRASNTVSSRQKRCDRP